MPPFQDTLGTLGSALALFALASCADSPSTSDPASGARAVLRAAPLEALAEVPPILGEVRVRTLTPPEEVAPWRVEGGVARLLTTTPEDGEPTTSLLIEGEQRTLIIPGPFSTAEVNRVEVTLQIQRRTRIHVQLMADGTPRLGNSPRVISSNAPQTVVADFPSAADVGESFEALAVTLPAGSGTVAVHSVALIHEPIERWFPEPGSAPVPMTVGGDTREAVVVSSAVPVGGELVASGAHQLRFSYAEPDALRSDWGQGQLEVKVRGVHGTVHTTKLPLSREGGWRSARIPLPAVAGEAPGPIEWELALVGAGRATDVVLIAEARVVLPREAPKTVLLVTSDTHRGDHLGLAGSGVPVATPTLDVLARRGVLFEHALSTSNITMPSHVALLTGVHPRDTGVIDNATFLSGSADTLAEAFRAAGYRTFGAVSASHLGEIRAGIGQGFDRFTGPSATERKANVTVGDLEAWLLECSDEPVFAWLHVFDAHGPYQPPAGFENVAPVEGLQEGDAHAASIQAYRGEVSFVDAQLGRLLEVPRLEQAIVAVTADHGEVLGNHAIWFQHARLYMDTVWVPLILSWPGGPRGERVAARVQHLGLGRTLLDLAGLSGIEFPGENLLGEGVADDQRPHFAIASAARSASITHGNWHLILNLRRHQAGNEDLEMTWRERHQVELFDLSRDPGCTLDRQQNYKRVATQLRHGLVRWLSETQDQGWAEAHELDAGTRAQLQALGYTGEATDLSQGWFDPDCECDWCARYP